MVSLQGPISELGTEQFVETKYIGKIFRLHFQSTCISWTYKQDNCIIWAGYIQTIHRHDKSSQNKAGFISESLAETLKHDL